jgi:hypothetical protein
MATIQRIARSDDAHQNLKEATRRTPNQTGQCAELFAFVDPEWCQAMSQKRNSRDEERQQLRRL